MDASGSFADPSGAIVFPNQTSTLEHLGLDIGGSLAKLVYFDPIGSKDRGTSVGGKLHFITFETRRIDECIAYIAAHELLGRIKTIRITGGGAYKYADLIKDKLHAELQREDEMETVITGTNFLLHNVPMESFTFDPESTTQNPRAFFPIERGKVFPYLLVNVGSGVSILKVDSAMSYQRIDGTSLGGGTFWGLCNLLTGADNFDEMLELSAKGDSTKVDLLVGDIYGTDYSNIGLPAHIIASSFGKVMHDKSVRRAGAAPSTARREDIAASLLKMICNNIGQIAYHNAMRHGIKRIYFGGHFIRNHPPSMARISAGINYWSKSQMQALFLLHEGYLGALGAFLKGVIGPPAVVSPPPAAVAAAPSKPAASSWLKFFNLSWNMDNQINLAPTKATGAVCDCGRDFCEGLLCQSKR